MTFPRNIFLTILLGLSVLIAGAAESETETESKAFEEKRSSRPGWEYWISAPFWLIASPWIILHKGIEKSIGIVDDYQIIPAVKRVLISEDETRIIMPTHSSPIGSGVRYLKKELVNRESELNLIATYGLAHRHSLSLDWQYLQLSHLPVFMGVEAGYHLKTDEAWYGIGRRTKFDDGAVYALREFYGAVTFEYQLSEKILSGIRTGVSHYGVEDAVAEGDTYVTRKFGQNSLPGITDEALLGKMEAHLGFDNRDRKGHPVKGWEIDLNTGAFQQMNGGDFGYWKSSLDIRRYVHLFYGRTLAFRLQGQTMRAYSGKDIPFYNLSELGVKETIRGFHRGRFHDRDRLIGTLEYRYPVWTPRERAIDAVLFFDGGKVAHNIFTDAVNANLHYGIGGGFRFYGSEDLVAKIELARSREMWRFYFVLN